MTTTKLDPAARIAAIMSARDVAVLPVGMAPAKSRGIMGPKMPAHSGWRKALTGAFTAAALVLALQSAPSHAAGPGYDASVYSQGAGQVMQQGTGVRMTVIGVRPVTIELPPEQPSQTQQVAKYAVATGAGAIGVWAGNAMGGNSGPMRQILGVIGGGLGAVAGAAAGEAVTHNEARQVPGTEITMEHPSTHQVQVVTQAGEQQFATGDRVLLLNVNGAARVVPDRTPVVERTAEAPAVAAGAQLPQTRTALVNRATEMVAQTASMMGLRVDTNRLAEVLASDTGPARGTFDGTVVGVDRASGLVYQSLGKGQGFVHMVNSLDRVPKVGERVTIHFMDGRGTVESRNNEQARTHGLGRG